MREERPRWCDGIEGGTEACGRKQCRNIQSTGTLESQNNDGNTHLDRYRQTKKLFPRNLSSHFRRGPLQADRPSDSTEMLSRQGLYLVMKHNYQICSCPVEALKKGELKLSQGDTFGDTSILTMVFTFSSSSKTLNSNKIKILISYKRCNEKELHFCQKF